MIYADAGDLTQEQRLMRQSCRKFVDDVVAPFIRGNAVIFLHMDATVDISHLKIVTNMFPETADRYAGPEE